MFPFWIAQTGDGTRNPKGPALKLYDPLDGPASVMGSVARFVSVRCAGSFGPRGTVRLCPCNGARGKVELTQPMEAPHAGEGN